MQLPNGVLKIVHGFPYAPGAPFEEKCAVMRKTLTELKEKGYDGIVTNVDIDVSYVDSLTDPDAENGYLRSEESWRVLFKRLEICRELGLRVWIYDEEGYPSGAAGTLTLEARPDLEALALAAVHHVLQPGESVQIPVPRGHLAPMGACGFYFDGDQVTQADLLQTSLSVPFADGFRFENNSGRKLLCLAFFTKHAFEGTHCQHNAFAVRRYIDVGHPDAGKVFAENTYRPYCTRLAPFFRDGTIEAFFADEPSYMGRYFNLLKVPPQTVHPFDPELPLYAMVHWSFDLVRYFEATRGYDLMQQLPWLFLGDSDHARKVRQDYYAALTELAQKNFFQPLADLCEEYNTLSSGHLPLEERITDHPAFPGNYFSILKTMHIPGMDMLDSRPERIWIKAFTPLLISSISRLHRDGAVMDEVSAYFQRKFSIPVTGQQVFTSLVMQHIWGATLFTSYYRDGEDSHLHETPDGRTVLQAFREVLQQTKLPKMPAVFLHYPYEAISANTVSPVDMAHVFSSILKEFTIPYPIDRADLDKDLALTPLVQDTARQQAKAVEQAMEDCMFALLNRQVPFLFADTESLQTHTPETLVVYRNALTPALLSLLPALQSKGCTIYCIGSHPALPAGVICLETPAELPFASALSGAQAGVAALWMEEAVLLANSDATEKELTLPGALASARELYSNTALPFSTGNGCTTFTLPPYGVALLRLDA